MKNPLVRSFALAATILTILLSCNGSSFSGEKTVSTSQLPDKAKLFLETHYSGVRIKEVILQHRASLIEYEVDLKGGTELHFDRNGFCTEVYCTKGSVPEAIIPEVILQQVKQRNPDPVIIKYEHEDRLYEVRLIDGTEFTFNRSMRLINIDK